MKAIVLRNPGGLEHLHLVDMPDPGDPRLGEIRVRIHANALNYHDYAVCALPHKRNVELIPMADGAGIVESVGDGVTEYRPGDHVISCFFPYWQDGAPTMRDFSGVPGDGFDGFAREVVVAPASSFTHAPTGWSHAEAATLTTAGLTAWRALVDHGGIKAGDTLAVLGTGGVSVFALQLAKAFGARVAVTSSSGAKLERAMALGADFVINYRDHVSWGEKISEWSGGGVDHVLEMAGPETLPQSIAACRPGGHIALVGVLTGHAGEVPTSSLIIKQIRLHGFVVGSRAQQKRMVETLNQLNIRPVIDRIFPLEQIAEAFRYEKSGQHFGKIALQI